MGDLPQLKIIIAGAEGAGKSEFIKIICPSCILNFGEENSKIPMDLGTAEWGEYTLRVMGIPGKKEFLFMNDVLLNGSSGAIILINVNEPLKIPEAIEFIKKISEKNIPFILAINTINKLTRYNSEEIKNQFNLDLDLIPVSTKSNWNIKEAVDLLIHKILEFDDAIIYEDNIKLD